MIYFIIYYYMNSIHIDETYFDKNLDNNDINSIDTDITYYSQYFVKTDTKNIIIFNKYDFLKEMLIIASLYTLLFRNSYNMLNVYAIDSLLSCIMFYIKYMDINIHIYRKDLIDRYIYNTIVFTIWTLFNFVFTFIDIYIWILLCPTIMNYIYDKIISNSLKLYIYDRYNIIIKKIICKYLTKIINIVINSVLNMELQIMYGDILPYYDKFSWIHINTFIIKFLSACIFNYVDSSNMRLPLIICKNIYMKDPKYDISNDNLYMKKIICDKKWDKFLDVYTLNRVVRMILNNNNKDNKLVKQIDKTVELFVFNCEKILLCWSISGYTNVLIGLLTMLLFDISLFKIFIVLIYMLISFNVPEHLLLLVLCEITYRIVDVKLFIN